MSYSRLDTTQDVENRYNELIETIEDEGSDPDVDDLRELADIAVFRKNLIDYCPDYNYGAQLIVNSSWREYAEDLLTGCYDVDTQRFPHNCLDWDQIVDQLKDGYTPLSYDGTTYWVA